MVEPTDASVVKIEESCERKTQQINSSN